MSDGEYESWRALLKRGNYRADCLGCGTAIYGGDEHAWISYREQNGDVVWLCKRCLYDAHMQEVSQVDMLTGRGVS